ncbi:alpha/beta hydrolase [Natrialba swarupiae]|uniref:Alpha/beta fold hydrolase n=1 Tax=Natrialba swarupiae TaxID=2448032 RepID=A0A5D5ARP9_9EURY|nr:alpha/beta fold hydrolase [Natrialba swarupiae]TYT61731.1 alpha/beta fold hydrolase [Natrialba swarupiae]
MGVSVDPKPVRFQSSGEMCRGDLYLPDEDTQPPIVVLAHGFGGERTWRLPAYARRFAQQGLAAFVFDYRTFGDSDGQPRNLVSPHRQLADWQAAVNHVRAREDVDGGRLALWGTSLSGGHVIMTAARDKDVTAVVTQVPFSDGLASVAHMLWRGGVSYARPATVGALRDLPRAVVKRTPHYVPIVNEEDRFGVLNTPNAKAAVEALVPADETFRNEVPGRVAATIPFYRPISKAEDVTCPTFVVEATRDRLIPSWTVRRLVAKLNDVECLRLSIGHFDVYTPPTFDCLVDRQTSFLCQHLRE